MKNKIKVLSAALIAALCLSPMHDSAYAFENLTPEAETANLDDEYPEAEGEELVLALNFDTGEITEIDTTPEANAAVPSLARSLTNYVTIAITPKAASYKITVTNLGKDAIDKVNLTCKIYKNSGAFMKSTTKTLKKLKPGNTSWTWNTSKGQTVQEKIVVSGTAKDGKDTISFSGSTVRYNFAGGKYGSMAAYDGQRHHMPSDNVSPLSTYKGPAIRMITSDHQKTASWGSSLSAKTFRSKEAAKIKNGEFLGAQQLGIRDVQKKFGSKYNAAINDMVSYTRGLGYKK